MAEDNATPNRLLAEAERGLAALLDRIDREAFERGKQAAELQPVPTPPPAGKAELTEEEYSRLSALILRWERCDDADKIGSCWRDIKELVASLRAEAVAKVERERDEARAELDRVRKELFEQQTREGEWHDWARRASGTDLVSADRLQCTIEEKLDELKSKPYAPPLTDAQVEELAPVLRDVYYGQNRRQKPWGESPEEWRQMWRNVIRTLAPRIARVQLRELGEEELTIAVAHYQLLRISGGVTSAEFDFVGFACRILELAQSEAPGGSGL